VEPEIPAPAAPAEIPAPEEAPPAPEEEVPDIITEFAHPWETPEEGWENVLETTDRALATMEQGLFTFVGSLRETLYGFKESVQTGPPVTRRPWFVLGTPVVLFLGLLLLLSSWGNTGNYYLVPMENGYLLKQGRFAPMGSRTVERLPGLVVNGGFAESYSFDQAGQIVQAYFLSRHQEALNNPEGPDYATARKHLEKALAYAPTFEEKDALRASLARLDFDLLMNQVEEALSSDAAAKVQEAKKLLDDAAVLAQTPVQKELLKENRVRAARALLALEQ